MTTTAKNDNIIMRIKPSAVKLLPSKAYSNAPNGRGSANLGCRYTERPPIVGTERAYNRGTSQSYGGRFGTWHKEGYKFWSFLILKKSEWRRVTVMACETVKGDMAYDGRVILYIVKGTLHHQIFIQ